MEHSPILTESMIHHRATPTSFERGYDYYESGAVLQITQRGDELSAEVEGSQYEPYQVSITLSEHGIESADCSCPYDWGGDCKHIVALLLAYMHSSEEIEQATPLDELLADLGRDDLEQLLLRLADQQPGLMDRIQQEIELLRASTATSAEPAAQPPRERQTSLDSESFRKQVRNALHSLDHMRPSEAYWHTDSIVSEIGSLLEQAWRFIGAGDGHNALIILKAITDEYVEGWMEIDDSNGELADFFLELSEAWTEAILTADLTRAEREEWAERLTEWQAEIDDYGVDNVFDAAQAAAVQGWDDPALQRVLAGEITEKGAWEDEAPSYADDLTRVRLKVLARQGRHQEYLHLAEAEGQYEPYVQMLVQQGQVQEAVEYGRDNLTTSSGALKLAQALAEKGELESAIQIGKHGLNLDGSKLQLAVWIRDTASATDRSELALEAAIVALQAMPTLESYLAVQELAGEQWNTLREELLEQMRQQETRHLSSDYVEVFLHEGLIDDAISALRDYADYETIAQVADAALPVRPDWVIQVSRKQAERIMDAGRAKAYHHAVDWVRRARDAYRASGHEAAWERYLTELLTKHARKYKLVPMLRSLQDQ